MFHDFFVFGAFILEPYFHLEENKAQQFNAVNNQHRYLKGKYNQVLFIRIFFQIKHNVLFKAAVKSNIGGQ